MPGVAPPDVWTETDRDVVVVTFQTDPKVPDTFQGPLTFAVDLGGNIRHISFLSLGINDGSWRITNDVI